MHDVTRRLRLSEDPDTVERERNTASALFRDAVHDASAPLTPETLQRMARQSIEAACVFWEEWDIAVLTPDLKENPK